MGVPSVIAPVPPVPPGFGRRRLMDGDVFAINKCVFDMDMKVCMEYDYKGNTVSFDLNTINGENRKDFGKSESAYFVVYEFELTENDILNEAKCIDMVRDVLPFDVCFDVTDNMNNVNMYFKDGFEHRLNELNWKNDHEWNEIYEFDHKNHFKKCANTDVVSICVEN